MMASDEVFFESDGSESMGHSSDESSDVELSEEEESAPAKGAAGGNAASTLKNVTNLSARKHKAQEVMLQHPEEVQKAELRLQKTRGIVDELRSQISGHHQEVLSTGLRRDEAVEPPAVPSPFSGRLVVPKPGLGSGHWQIHGGIDWETQLYLLKREGEEAAQNNQEMQLPRSGFTVLAQPGDKASVVFDVRIEVPSESTAEAAAAPADGAAPKVEEKPNEPQAEVPQPEAPQPEAQPKDQQAEAPQKQAAERVFRIERKNGVGCVLQREGGQTLVQLQDEQRVWVRNEDVTVQMPDELRFPMGFRVSHPSVGGYSGTLTSYFKEGDVVKAQVQFSPGFVRQFPQTQLISEKAYWSERWEKAKSALKKLEKKLPEAELEHENSARELHVVHQSLQKKEKALEDANKALGKVKHHNVLKVQTLVAFKRGKARPQQWRDITRFVELRWAVVVELADERPVVLSLEDCKGMARSVVQAKGVPGSHLISAAGQKLNRLPGAKPRKGAHLVLSRQEAKQIVRLSKANAQPPSPMHAFSLLKAALGVQPGVVLDGPVEEFYQGPEIGLIRVKEVPAPERLKDVLRPYQVSGFHWLVNNARNGLGCILADDMGLGKTLQAIALMLYMKEHGMLTKPMLVVVPKGLLGTWQKELKQWAGDALSVHCYVGQQRELLPGMVKSCADVQEPPQKMRRLTGKQNEKKLIVKEKKPKVRVAKQSADIFLTSYGTFRANAQALSVPDVFGGMLLDEAQQIKNYNTQISKAVKEVAEHVGPIRVSLSGTPVENSLKDLNSQFEYILPGYLASSRLDFQRCFGRGVASSVRRGLKRDKALAVAAAAAATGDEAAMAAAAKAVPAQDYMGLASQESLRRLVKPFLMRRLKTDPEIASDLPDKIQKDQECELTETQKRIYKACVDQCMKETLQYEGFERRGQVLKMMHALREVCNHPKLLADSRCPDSVQKDIFSCEAGKRGSGKIERLLELLEEILDAGEKVIIFSTSLKAINMLQELIPQHFQKRATPEGGLRCQEVMKIVGKDMSIDAREDVVEKFQKDPQKKFPVLLLSLGAGGVGLTLTEATHVIHFDRGYNPAKEAQATDRAHRIGQKSTVVVHKLTTKGTFEEKLNAIMEEKQKLSDVTVRAGEDWIADMSDRELRDLFSLSS